MPASSNLSESRPRAPRGRPAKERECHASVTSRSSAPGLRLFDDGFVAFVMQITDQYLALDSTGLYTREPHPHA